MMRRAVARDLHRHALAQAAVPASLLREQLCMFSDSCWSARAAEVEWNMGKVRECLFSKR